MESIELRMCNLTDAIIGNQAYRSFDTVIVNECEIEWTRTAYAA